MRLLFIGDIVGRAGRAALLDTLPKLRQAWELDCVIVNGENAAGGFGITETICADFLAAGADCVTLGNHAFDQREALVFIARQPRLIRPLNYPRGTPGRGANLIETGNGARVLVINLMGRVSHGCDGRSFLRDRHEIAARPLGAVGDAGRRFPYEASSESRPSLRISPMAGFRWSLAPIPLPTADYQHCRMARPM
jgi:calcineurin-like phosphoesterase